ncbi:MAG: hypothetical protein AB7D02_02385 [Candidatus Paceibacterota bacterium]
MKSIFITGALILIVIVCLGVLASAGILWLINLLKPLVSWLFPQLSSIEQTFISFLLIILIAIAIGYSAKILPKSRLFKRYLFFTGKNNIKNKPAVLVKFGDIYLIGLVTETQEINCNGIRQNFKRIFIPSSPIPFTGWTILASNEEIIPLKASYQEILGLVSSWGTLGSKAIEVLEPKMMIFSGFKRENVYPQVIHKNTALYLDDDMFE